MRTPPGRPSMRRPTTAGRTSTILQGKHEPAKTPSSPQGIKIFRSSSLRTLRRRFSTSRNQVQEVEKWRELDLRVPSQAAAWRLEVTGSKGDRVNRSLYFRMCKRGIRRGILWAGSRRTCRMRMKLAARHSMTCPQTYLWMPVR